MTDLSSNIILVIAVTSIATYLSRSLGVLFSERIDENSKIFRLFDCIAYSTLAALVGRMIIFPAGVVVEADLIIRLFVLISCVFMFILSKKNKIKLLFNLLPREKLSSKKGYLLGFISANFSRSKDSFLFKLHTK